MTSVFRKWLIDSKVELAPADVADSFRASGFDDSWRSTINSINLPRGQSYGIARFLMRSADAAAIMAKDKIDIKGIEQSFANATASPTTTRTLTFKNFVPIKTYAVEDANAPCTIIELADKRWHLARAATNRRFNLREVDDNYKLDSTNAGTPWTWQEILGELWGDLPSTEAGTCPTLASAPSSVPENLVFEGMFAWEAINLVLTTIGHAVVLDPFEDTLAFVYLLDTQPNIERTKAVAEQEGRWLYAYLADGNDKTNYPADAAVTFPRNPLDPLSADWIPFMGVPFVATKPVAGGQTGTSQAILDVMFVRGDPVTPDNDTELQARAVEIADAVEGFYRSAAEPSIDVYGGFINAIPGTQVTRIIWRTDPGFGCRTEIRNMIESWKIPWPKLDLVGSGGGGPNFYVYELLEAITIGSPSTSTVDIYDADDESTLLFEDIPWVGNLHMFDDQDVGDRGTCTIVDGVAYAINAPCE